MNKSSKTLVIGIDEVGRGPLAGPVYVCAVAMPYVMYRKARWPGLTDSKKLSAKQREVWHIKAKEMEKAGLVSIGIARQSAHMIDTKGIGKCIALCIEHCLAQLDVDPNDAHVLLDGGLKAPLEYTSQKTIIKGDAIHKIISLASVVAKVTRDTYMTNMSKKHPQYDWSQNKGYGTKAHVLRLKRHGLTSLHRTSFLTRILDI